MPHIIVKGCSLEEVQSIKNNMITSLSSILDIPEEHFTLEHLNSVFVSDERYPFICVKWFDRGPEKKQVVANTITDLIHTFHQGDVTVYFEDLIKENYFENKKHF